VTPEVRVSDTQRDDQIAALSERRSRTDDAAKAASVADSFAATHCRCHLHSLAPDTFSDGRNAGARSCK